MSSPPPFLLSDMSLNFTVQSIAQTRLHFQRMVAGLESDEDDEHASVKWKEDFTPHPRKPGEEPKAGRKGKERASLGSIADEKAGGNDGRRSK